MTSAPVSHSTPAALPGLDHLRGHVQNWDAAVRTLALTATALAESLGAAAPQKRGWPAAAAAAAAEQEAAACGAPPTSTPRSLLPLWPPAPPSLVLPAGHLKPGRVFVVANLQGAYYTLLELLARHKFDFRTDNLLHLGNLVAPPPPPPPTGGGDHYMQQSQQQQQQQQQQEEQKVVSGSAQPRRFRNSSSVLKLVRRHGGLGPMGTNECLALLAAARANRQRAEQQQAAAAEEEEEEEEVGRRRMAGALRKAPGGRCSALSLQLTAAVARPGAAAAAVPFQRCSGARPSCTPATSTPTPTPTPTATTSAPAASCWLGLSGRSSDSSPDNSDGDGEDGPREESDVEMVAAPMTPHHLPGADHAAAPHPTTMFAPPPAAACSAGGGGAAATSVGSGPSLDDAGLVQLLSMPACVVLQAYGIQLQHVSPREEDGSGAAAAAAAGAYGERRFHLLFSHRRPGGRLPAGAGGGGGGAATATGLASGRGDVVRFAVLPPVRTLQRWSPGFGAAMAAAAAPSREDLMLEVMEEPLSELDS
ncbi:hypothetical protein PLESTB_000532300 [Pleodorina starrii]|uniref:Uncharacterized protein n=1 Tax=Pleodorina starrii TaxID=330485 RepID=A0A9W6F0D9_9CHLO|nr:hypothetical protein PLESTB_000532300 [Pleodorina starrii]